MNLDSPPSRWQQIRQKFAQKDDGKVAKKVSQTSGWELMSQDIDRFDSQHVKTTEFWPNRSSSRWEERMSSGNENVENVGNGSNASGRPGARKHDMDIVKERFDASKSRWEQIRGRYIDDDEENYVNCNTESKWSRRTSTSVNNDVHRVLDKLRHTTLAFEREELPGDDDENGADEEKKKSDHHFMIDEQDDKIIRDDEISQWVKRIDQKFRAQTGTTTLDEQKQMEQERQAKALVREVAVHDEKARMIKLRAKNKTLTVKGVEEGSTSTGWSQKIKPKKTKSKKPKTDDEHKIEQANKNQLFNWAVEASKERETPSVNVLEEQRILAEAKLQRKSAAKARSERLKLDVIRLEAKIQVRIMKTTFQALKDHTKKRKLWKLEVLELERQRVEQEKTKALLAICFDTLQKQAASIKHLRKRASTRRMLRKWRFVVKARKLKKQRLLEDELDELRMEKAHQYYQKRCKDRIWLRWTQFIRIRRFDAEQKRNDELRRENMNNFLGKMKRQVQERGKSEKTSIKREEVPVKPPSPAKKPRTVVDVPKTSFELRALERQQKRDELRAQYRELAMMREEEKNQRYVEQKQRELDEKRRRTQEKKLEQERVQKLRQAVLERKKLSALHRDRAILWYHGLKPWIRLMRLAKRNMEEAMDHDLERIQRKMFGFWKEWAEAAKMVRRKKENAMNRAAMNFRKRSLLRLGWKLISDRHFRLRARFLAVRSQQRMYTMQRMFDDWKNYITISHDELKTVQAHMNQNLKQRVFQKWTEYLKYQTKERQRTAEKQQMWSKVRTWLDDL